MNQLSGKGFHSNTLRYCRELEFPPTGITVLVGWVEPTANRAHKYTSFLLRKEGEDYDRSPLAAICVRETTMN